MELLISVLFVYGLATLLVEADGPYGILYKTRKRISPLSCYMCAATWVAAIAAVFISENIGQWFAYTFAILGGAILINRITGR